MFLGCLFLKVDFILKTKYNLYLFALSWLEIKHKLKHCQGGNSSIFIHKIYKEKFIKAVKLQMRNNESIG